MSSSRSIAAARNRRSGETSTPKTFYAQPQQYVQPQYYQQQPPQQLRQQQPGQQLRQQQPRQQIIEPQKLDPHENSIEEMRSKIPIGKIAISDAFALVTVRLGRVESFIQKVENGEIDFPKNADEETSSSSSDNVVIKSIISRIEDLEKSKSATNKTLETKIASLNDNLLK